MGKVLAVCDEEEIYIKRLMQYMNQSDNMPFEVHAFTHIESLLEYGRDHPIELLLISPQMMQQKVKEIPIKKIILLSDGNPIELDEEYSIVNKYQASSNLIREVMQSYLISNPSSITQPRHFGNVVGILALGSRCLMTSFSLAAALWYGKRKKTLYINLEEYDGLCTVFEAQQGADLSDLIYYYREKKEESGMRAALTAQEWEGIFILPPAQYPQDLRNVKEEEWIEWIGLLAEQSGFEVIVIAFGSAVPLSPELLSVCKLLYMPIKQDWMAVNKLVSFQNYCRIQEKEELFSGIRKVVLPDVLPIGKESDYRRFLQQGVFAEETARILQGDIE